ncbi:Dabb family protein [Flectobacillus major]|uniref:Dabb family protein n=1 Tax=Flectobacillus major TaxID=103 RepID=UPI00047DFF5B|nr:Dabb family protein [Flectobacillus major]
MKKKITLWAITIMLVSSVFCLKAQSDAPKILKHIVTITFKQGATLKEIKEVDQSFKNLALKRKEVKGYEWGVVPINQHNKEIKHVYVSSFVSEKELAQYGASPEHQKHIKLGVAIIKSVDAVDFYTEK